mmetsp:Transcript_28210/g.100184  ORF Transcript_28210/g.100184 Transcript_28210/m.100184 type:complete len:232 (+) Transcript_28210:2179-2874(+)
MVPPDLAARAVPALLRRIAPDRAPVVPAVGRAAREFCHHGSSTVRRRLPRWQMLLRRRRQRPRRLLLYSPLGTLGHRLPLKRQRPRGRDGRHDQDGGAGFCKARLRLRTLFGPRLGVLLQPPARPVFALRRWRLRHAPRRDSAPSAPAPFGAGSRARAGTRRRTAQGRYQGPGGRGQGGGGRGAAQGRAAAVRLRGEREDGAVPEPRAQEPHLRPRPVVRRLGAAARAGAD